MHTIHIIGFGASTIGFLRQAIKSNLHKDYQIVVYERGGNMGEASFGGMKYDGKLIASKEIGGELQIPLDQQRKAQKYITDHIPSGDNNLTRGNSFKVIDETYQKFYRNGFTLLRGEFIHCGTDLLVESVYGIYFEFVEQGIKFKFGHELKHIVEDTVCEGDVSDSKYILFFSDKYNYPINRADSNNPNYTIVKSGDKVVFGIGRSGASLIKNSNLLSNYIESSSYVDLGIRYEFPSFITSKIDGEMYEIKCSYVTSNGMVARLFCQNPNGFVTMETYDDNGTKLYSVNGHSENKQKSKNTNLAILVRHKFTQPFNDSVAFGSAIARLANMLGGGDKVLLQTYGDFVRGKRTKKIGRTHPTLDEEKYILGDLNYVLPSKTRESIIEFIEQFGKVVPGFNLEDNLCYGVEVKFYSTKMNSKDGIYFMGDCSGYTGSIIKAFCHGEEIAKLIQVTN